MQIVPATVTTECPEDHSVPVHAAQPKTGRLRQLLRDVTLPW